MDELDNDGDIKLSVTSDNDEYIINPKTDALAHFEIPEEIDEEPEKHQENPKTWNFRRILQFLKIYWKVLVTIIVPVVLFPIIRPKDPTYCCLYVTIIMMIYWATEALPYHVTSLLPIVLLPFFQIMSTDVVCSLYFTHHAASFFGTVIIALAMEYCGLNKRIALKIMSLVGCSHKKLNLIIIVSTLVYTLSVPADIAMILMYPIIHAILEELEILGITNMYLNEEINKINTEKIKQPSKTTICYFAGALCASKLGSNLTIYSSPTILTFKGIYETMFYERPGVNSFNWILSSIPIIIICTIFTYFYHQWIYIGYKRKLNDFSEMNEEKMEIIKSDLKEKYQNLKSMTQHEFFISILIFLYGLLIFSQRYLIYDGRVRVHDASFAIVIVILLFILPNKFSVLNKVFNFKTNNDSGTLVTWKYILDNFPWKMILIIGAGHSLMQGGRVSGMSQMIASPMSGLLSLPYSVYVVMLCLIATFLAQFFPGVVIANILLPVVGEMAQTIHLEPIFLMCPVAICCNFSFISPISSNTNALLMEKYNLNLKNLVISSIGPLIFAVLIVALTSPTLVSFFY